VANAECSAIISNQNNMSSKHVDKLKTPSEDRIFSMDRGGVEPLERGDKSAPETLRTRPSSTLLWYQLVEKEKSSLARALRRTKGFVHSGLVTRRISISLLLLMSSIPVDKQSIYCHPALDAGSRKSFV